MNILKKDLEQDLQDEIDRPNTVIDSFVESYKTSSKSEYLKISKVGDAFLFSTENLSTDVNKIALTETDYVTEADTEVGRDPKYTKTSVNDAYVLSKGFSNIRFPSALNTIDCIGTIPIDNKVLKYKSKGNFILVLTTAGELQCYKITGTEIVLQFTNNAVTDIRTNFVIPDFQPFDILDICPMGNIVLISTKKHGIFSLEPRNGVNNRYLPELNGVTSIEVLPNKKLLLCVNTLASPNVILCDVSGIGPVIIEKYNSLRMDSQQKPISSASNDTHFAILGTPLENGYSTQNIHLWRLSSSGQYLNIDHELFPHTNSAQYAPKLTQLTNDKLYVIGDNSKGVFIWVWDIFSPSKEYKEYNFAYTNLDNIDKFYVDNGVATFDVGDRIVKLNLNTNTVIANYKLSESPSVIWFKASGNNIFALSKSNIAAYTVPNYTDVPSIEIPIENDKPFMSYIYIKCDDVSRMSVSLNSASLDVSTRIVNINKTSSVLRISSLKTNNSAKIIVTLQDKNKIDFLSIKTVQVYLL